MKKDIRLSAIVLCALLIAYTLSSCARDCYANGGKPIKEDSKRSINHFNRIKS